MYSRLPSFISIPSPLLLFCLLFPDFLTRLLLFLQLKNSGEIKLEPLSASLVRSVAAVTSQASVAMVTKASGSSAGDDDGLRLEKSTAVTYIPAQQQASSSTSIHQERAPKYFSMTQSGDPGHPESELNSSPHPFPESREKFGAPPAPTSSTDHRQEEESGRAPKEEEVRQRQQGGAREAGQGSSIKDKRHSPDRDRDDRQQHPRLQHFAEPSLWGGESESLPSWRAADGDSHENRDRAEGGGRGKGGYLREAAAAHSSSTHEQERGSGPVSGRKLLC